MRKIFDFFSGLFFGAVFGAALALLLAPDAGTATKKRLMDRFNSVLEEGRRAAAERRAELEAQFAQAKRYTRN